jgi:hypothetical protein
VGQLQAELEKRLNELGVATACVEEKESQLVELSSKLSKVEGGLVEREKELAQTYTLERQRLVREHETAALQFRSLEADKREALHELSSVTAQVVIDAVVNGGGGWSGAGGWCWWWCCGGEVEVVAGGWSVGW